MGPGEDEGRKRRDDPSWHTHGQGDSSLAGGQRSSLLGGTGEGMRGAAGHPSTRRPGQGQPRRAPKPHWSRALAKALPQALLPRGLTSSSWHHPAGAIPGPRSPAPLQWGEPQLPAPRCPWPCSGTHSRSRCSHPPHRPGWRGAPGAVWSNPPCQQGHLQQMPPPWAHWHFWLSLPHSPAISAPAQRGWCRILQRFLCVSSPRLNKPGASNPRRAAG